VSTSAREANDLIDRRTFSWTELFNTFERTLPENVRFTSVRPALDAQRHIVLTINVIARGVDDVNQFMENLDTTGAFRRINVVQERTNEEGQIESALEALYLPAVKPPAAAAAPAATRTPATPNAPGTPSRP
jgi:Tfp pilus assembly protein PilN